MRYRYSYPGCVVRLRSESVKIIDLANSHRQLLRRTAGVGPASRIPAVHRCLEQPEYRHTSRMTQQQHYHRDRDRTAMSLLTAGDTGKGCDRYE
jgi:hypothetical protein